MDPQTQAYNPLLVQVLLQSLAMLLTAWVIPRIYITSIFGAVLTVVALSLVNATIWDAALFFSLPYSLSTHALLLFLANGFIFWTLVKILPGIEVRGFLPALAAPVVFTLLSVVITTYGRDVDWPGFFDQLFNTIGNIRDYFREGPAVA